MTIRKQFSVVVEKTLLELRGTRLSPQIPGATKGVAQRCLRLSMTTLPGVGVMARPQCLQKLDLTEGFVEQGSTWGPAEISVTTEGEMRRA